MAVFGKKDDPEVIALREQLAAAQSHIGELQRWITQIRGAETGGLEAELRELRAEVEKASAARSEMSAAVAAAHGSLLNPQSGRRLDSPGGATADGTDLQIYDCNGLDPQKWNVPA